MNAEKDLKEILDLLAEWRKKYRVSYVTMFILDDGRGDAYARYKGRRLYDVCGTYEDCKEHESAGKEIAPAEEAARAEVEIKKHTSIMDE